MRAFPRDEPLRMTSEIETHVDTYAHASTSAHTRQKQSHAQTRRARHGTSSAMHITPSFEREHLWQFPKRTLAATPSCLVSSSGSTRYTKPFDDFPGNGVILSTRFSLSRHVLKTSLLLKGRYNNEKKTKIKIKRNRNWTSILQSPNEKSNKTE